MDVDDGQESLDVSELMKAPCGDLLSELELSLCSKVGMLPLHYLAAKDAIAREAYCSGILTAEGVRRVLKANDENTAIIHDFFVKEMMINGPN
eukprot:gene4952-6925_t